MSQPSPEELLRAVFEAAQDVEERAKADTVRAIWQVLPKNKPAVNSDSKPKKQ